MKKVLILGANGQIARIVTDRILKEQADVELTLFLRNSSRLNDLANENQVMLIDGDITDYDAVNAAMKDQDLVYIAMVDYTKDNVITKNVIKAMKANGVQRIVESSLLGLYNEVPGEYGRWNYEMVKGGLDAAINADKLLAESGLDYTTLRFPWLNDRDEVKYTITHKNDSYLGVSGSRQSMMEKILLNDGNSIPAIGFGVFRIPSDGSTYQAVLQALKAGYRHIDTAVAYFNEAEVGKAIKDSGIPRKDIFVTSKLWLQDYGYEAAKKGLATSLQKLGLDYIDLYLLHQPYGDLAGAWKALEEGKKNGQIKSIGVSNMTPKLWNKFVPDFATIPAVNQVEFNPYSQQKALREILDQNDVKIEAWGPLGQGNSDLFAEPIIKQLAAKYQKDAGQIILRFENQEGIIVLPKSTHETRIKSNLNIFDFELTDAELAEMRALDKGHGTHDPDAPGVGEMLLSAFDVHAND